MTDYQVRIPEEPSKAMTLEMLLMWLERRGSPLLLRTPDGWICSLHREKPKLMMISRGSHKRAHGAAWDLAQRVHSSGE